MSELPYDPRMDPQLPGGAALNWPPPETQPPAPVATFNPPLVDTPPPVQDLPPDPFPPTAPQPAPQQQAGPPAGPVGSTAGPVGDDAGTILARPDVITLVSGRQVYVRKLATRELLSLLAIGLAGVGPNLGEIGLSLDPDNDDTDVFVAKFAGLIISGMLSPASRDETMAFLRAVVDPVGKVSGMRVDKAQRARNDALDAALDAELYNADVDDTISIVEAVAANNAGDMQQWGKRLAGIWRLAQRTGRIPASPTSRG